MWQERFKLFGQQGGLFFRKEDLEVRRSEGVWDNLPGAVLLKVANLGLEALAVTVLTCCCCRCRLAPICTQSEGHVDIGRRLDCWPPQSTV